ncbi:putative bifunctional diguanylate cyclase/phosphodiesterase [Arthrobacter sp. SO3]|uniref:putative bifunctional diguanylate cyclase/phosphodiesterase n=1 Tax=Arthrobacter sp. SO3 TaxID=1897057 RepID=UPI001CFFE7F8|nr:EAL domain-containing protein [Arthrobacter sp. SO3]MCB5293272.1 Cyclic di-GMP phosphodiesterase Gmr [Arthrobacter sp. SO3]
MKTDPPDPRLHALVEGIVRIAGGDLTTRIPHSGARDDVAAVIAGINLMADDLQTIYQELEQRVESRTAMLREAQVELERMALTDPLTQLANRTALNSVLSHALAETSRGELPPALLVLDLDSFKGINDTLGHSAGDDVLRVISRRLQNAVRDTDTVARLGGDEFAVMLPKSNLVRARRVANRILKALGESLEIGDLRITCGTSIGLRVAEPGQSVDDLVMEADTAMYAAKAQPHSSIKVFEPALLYARRLQSVMITELREAIRQDQLTLHYQPVVDLATKRIEGVEALVRWNHPERGLLMPDSFIPLAEETGMIVDLGHWVLRNAVRQLRHWQQQLNVDGSFNVRVNISTTELQNLDLIENVRDVLRETGVDAANLIIELTESMAINGGDVDKYSLSGLRRLGVQLEIDDFGTGYSSISYLRKLPVNVVKIDKSLFDGLGSDEEQSNFVAAVLHLIHACGLKAVAEGIETAEQAAELVRLGCASGQGYYFGRPVPAAQIEALIGPGAPGPV